MTRRRALLVALTAGVGLLALAATVGGTEHAGVDVLRGIDDAAATAVDARKLAASPWVSVAGLGVGLALGLAVGGGLGYAYYRRKL